MRIGKYRLWMTGLTLVLGAVCLAHDDPLFEQDRQPPYEGPGFRSAPGAFPPVSFPASDIQLLSWLPVGEFGNHFAANDCWGYVSGSGREYAIIGLSGGTGFVEVTDPGDPQIVAVMNGPQSSWRDIKTYLDHAYAVSEGGRGVQVFDLSLIDAGTVTLVRSVMGDGTNATHNVAINEDSGFLYRCGGGGSTVGLRIYSLADPGNPVLVSEWHNRYVHDAQVVSYLDGPFAGREVAFCSSEQTASGGAPRVHILDVTDKGNITTMSVVSYSTPAFSHQCWLSPDKQYLYVNDELDEVNGSVPTTTTRIIDVSDLFNPSQVGTFTTGLSSIDHNLYTRDNYIFEANYRSGLRVFDATNPLAPVEIAYFDTYPDDDNPNFNGLWSNYPYLPSGIIVGSDIEKGLFVWRNGPPTLAFSFSEGLPEMIDDNGDSIRVEITGQNGGVLEPGTAMLHYDPGTGFVTVEMTEITPGVFDAVFPGIPCGQEIDYFFSAQDTDGTVVRDPSAAPGMTYLTAAADARTVNFSDNMETDTGWIVGAPGDDATTGIWVRVDPIGTDAQPENDNPGGTGTLCWITGQGSPGGSVGENDVDSGSTTLTSPRLDAIGGEVAYLVYYRWYSNNQGSAPNSDSMLIEISDDDGVTWTLLEEVTENLGVWVEKRVKIEDFVTPTDQLRVRFIASDLGSGSIVEAGVDDVNVLVYTCAPSLPGDFDGNGRVDLADFVTFAGCFGGSGVTVPPGACTQSDFAASDLDDDLDVDLTDFITFATNFTG